MNKDSKILITGAKGFLGRCVCEELRSKGYANIIECANSDRYYHIESKTLTNKCDLRNKESVESLVRYNKPDVVIHLAARVGGIGANQENPGAFIYDNLVMGVNLIEACKDSVTKFVLVGTVCSYPKFCPVPFEEKNIWEGYPEETNAPYGVAKKTLSVMLSAYRQQYGLNGITVIPVNMYGPHDNFNPESSHVIPALIKKVEDAGVNGDLEIWGTGGASREFLHVRDSARGIVMATESYEEGEPVNLGTNSEIKIKSLVDIIRTDMGHQGNVIYDTSKPDGQPRRCLDVSKAKIKFGFEAQISLEAGIRETIEWYKKSRGEPLNSVDNEKIPQPYKLQFAYDKVDNRSLSEKMKDTNLDLKNQFTLIVSVHERHDYIQSLMDYYQEFPCDIIVVDSSEKACSIDQDKINDGIFNSPDYNVFLIHCPGELYYRKMHKVLTTIRTPYVLEMCDDDIVYKEGICECVNFLKHNKQYACCDGFWENNRGNIKQENEIKNLIVHNFISDEPTQRVKFFLNDNFKAINHSVIRTDVLRACYEFQLENKSMWPIRWWDKILMFLFCFLGNYKALPVLYGKRRDWPGHNLMHLLNNSYPKELQKEVPWRKIIKTESNYSPLIDFCVRMGYDEDFSKKFVKESLEKVYKEGQPDEW